MTRRARPAPKDLEEGGLALWRNLTREFEFNAAELELCHQLCVVIDEISAMRADLRDMGMVVSGSEGQPRVNPLVPQLAAHRRVADQLVAALALPLEGEVVGRRRSAQAKQAADSRWRKPKITPARVSAMQRGGA